MEGEGLEPYNIYLCPLCGKELVYNSNSKAFLCIDYPNCSYKTRFISLKDYDYKDNLIRVPSLSFKERKSSNGFLIPTSNFSYGDFPFEYFNYIQSKVFKEIDNDVNLIVRSPTSSGKTAIAEMLIFKAFSLGKKAIYVSPFRAISKEKYNEWKIRFKNKKVVLFSGDEKIYNWRKDFTEGDLIIITLEMLDSKIKKFNFKLDRWINDVYVMIIDEAHIIYVGQRGDKLEAVFMNIFDIYKNIRVLLLSATLANTKMIAKWISSLNRKKTKIIKSDFRPTSLNTYIFSIPSVRNKKLKFMYLLEALKSMNNKKILIFVHSRFFGNELKSFLLDNGLYVKFHSGELSREERTHIEQEFLNGKLNILLATTTLAWGVNLPAEVVFVWGVERYGRMIPLMDIIQMIGRAGRFGIKGEGKAYIVLEYKNLKSTMKYISKGLKNVPFFSSNDLDFHLLGYILKRKRVRIYELFNWYKKSFSSNFFKTEKEVQKSLDRLLDYEAISYERKEEIIPTRLSYLSISLYFHPLLVKRLKDNMNMILKNGFSLKDLKIAAWTLGESFLGKEVFDFPKTNDVMRNLYNYYLKNNLPISESGFIFSYLFYLLLKNESFLQSGSDELERVFNELLTDFPRIYTLYKKICSLLEK